MSKYIAVDLGASNGRVIAGDLESFQTVNRFVTRNEYVDGSYFWDILYIFAEIKKGIKEAVKLYGNKIKSIGIDTWGVDYVLLDKSSRLLGFPFMYRDHRTDSMMEEVFRIIPKRDIYSTTGIQFAQFNTLYQLASDKKNNPEMLDAAAHYLSIPDLLNYWLSGVMANEYSHATTTQLYNPNEKTWSWDMIEKLGLPRRIFHDIVPSGTVLGQIKDDILTELGIDPETRINVTAVGCHDTASAVAAVPVAKGDNNIFLSSGTWSLLGIESDKPIINEDTFNADMTNEGTVSGGIRLLKNIMGLWILQESKRWWDRHGKQYSWEELSEMADSFGPVNWRIDPDNALFFHPSSDSDPMPERIKSYCRDHEMPVPDSAGEIVRGIFESLAQTYRKTIFTLEQITGESYKRLYIVGGGSRERLLCRLTAEACSIEVSAGPAEATALGNILVQELSAGAISSIEQGRAIIRKSQNIVIYGK